MKYIALNNPSWYNKIIIVKYKNRIKGGILKLSRSLEIKCYDKEKGVKNALLMLNVSRNEVIVETIRKSSRGFLGIIGRKEGIYRVTVVK